MQRSYVEFQRFAEQIQMTSPQSQLSHLHRDWWDSKLTVSQLSSLHFHSPRLRQSPMRRVIYVSLKLHRCQLTGIDDRLVRIALQRWFTRICEDPVLLKDEELRSFIESDFGVSLT